MLACMSDSQAASPSAPTFATLDREHGERFQSLRRELGVESFGINLIVLRGGERGRIHTHEHQEEVFLVLAGTLTLIVQGAEHELGPDRVARVPAKLRRQLVNARPEPLVLLALGAAGEHVGRDGSAWESWEEAGPGRPPLEVPLPADLPVG
jgi:mannose-6-phosphate isomerase-like protein (cupin superfamily)